MTPRRKAIEVKDHNCPGGATGETSFLHFHIVIDDIGSGGNYFFQRRCIALKIGNQYFDFAVRQGLPQPIDAISKNLRPAIRQIIAGNGSNDDVFQVHFPHGGYKMINFVFINWRRLAVFNIAVKAIARADIAEN